MTVIASMVEGDGEVAALPVLLRRLGEWHTPAVASRILPPIRVRRDRFLNRDEEFRRHLLLAAAKCGDTGWILILLDADDNCPTQLGAQILAQAQAYVPHRRVSVVLAMREFEAWFIAAAPSLDGQRGFTFAAGTVVQAESVRNAKGWMEARLAGGAYRETTEHPAFTARMDLEQALSGSRSFRKLCKEWDRQQAMV